MSVEQELTGNEPKHNVIDLFSGPGIGASGVEPFFNLPVAMDKSRDACNSYSLNHKNTSVHCVDIRDVSFVQGDFDGIMGLLVSPPCQSFSQLNQKRDTNDDRANLIFEFIRAVEEIKPKFALFENVSSVPKEMKERLVKILQKMGYFVQSHVVYASDYGSIQKRRRWIVTIDRTRFIFPKPHPTQLRARDILQPAEAGSEISMKPETFELIQRLEAGKWTNDIDKVYKAYFILLWDIILPAVVNPNKLRYVHPSRIRYLNYHELLSAFGVPAYKLSGTVTSWGQQLANGFPRELAEAFAIEFSKYYN